MSPEISHVSLENSGESNVDGLESVSISMQTELGRAGFSVGWVEVSEKDKNMKSGRNKSAPKRSSEAGKSNGADHAKEHKKGTWTRLPNRPNNELMLMDKVDELGLKRKAKRKGHLEGLLLKTKKSKK